jgi:hypothetical protein
VTSSADVEIEALFLTMLLLRICTIYMTFCCNSNRLAEGKGTCGVVGFRYRGLLVRRRHGRVRTTKPAHQRRESSWSRALHRTSIHVVSALRVFHFFFCCLSAREMSWNDKNVARSFFMLGSISLKFLQKKISGSSRCTK